MSRLLVFLISLFALQVQAATYYVSTSGSDSNNGTSTATPWADLSVSVGKLNAGDTLLLKRGDTFNETSKVEIVDANVVMGAYGDGANPIIDGQMTYPVDDSHYAPMVRLNAVGVTVQDIEVRNSNGKGIEILKDDGIVQRVKVNQTYMSGIIAASVNNPKVLNSTVIHGAWGWKNDPNYPYTVMPAAMSFKTTTGAVAKGNYVGPGWGEGIGVWWGSQNFTVEDNHIFEQRNIGIYVDFSQNGVIRNNVVLGGSLTDYHRTQGHVGAGICINNENFASPGNGAAASKNIDIYNNIVVNAVNGIAFWNQFEPTNHANIRVVNNTFIDNKVNVALMNTTYTNTIFRNNLFVAYDAGTAQTNTASASLTGVTFDYNMWIGGSRSAPFAGANDVTSGGVLPKTSGWKTFTGFGNFNIADAKPSSGSTSIGAGTTSLNGLVLTTDILKNPVNTPRDIGAIANAVAPPPSGTASILSITPTSLSANTNGFSAAGVDLSGVKRFTVSDGVDAETGYSVFPAADGSGFTFDTGTLTSIDLTNPIFTATYATPTYLSYNPRVWSKGQTTLTDYVTQTGIYTNSTRVASNGQTWHRLQTTIGSAASTSDTVEIWFDYSAGTSNKSIVYATNTAGTISYAGNVTGTHSQATTSAGTVTSYEKIALSSGIYRSKLKFTPAVTGNISADIGPYTTTVGQDVIVHGVRAWINGVEQTVTYDFSPPFSATLGDLNTDNVIDPISAANGSNLFALSGDIGGVSIPFLTPNVSGSVATFKSPDLSGLANGNQTLTLNVAQPAEIDQTPTGWPTNTATALVTSYTGTHLGYGGGAKLTVGTGGADWGGFKVDDLVTVAQGDVIEQWVDVVQSTGGQVRVSLTNQTAGGYVDYKGILGALSSTAQTACSSSTLSETAQDGMTRIKILCTSAAAGAYRLSITTNSSVVGDAVAVLGRTTFVNATPIAKTLTVTNPGGIVPEPEPIKRLKLGTPLSKITRNGVPATFTYTSVKIYDKNPATDRTAQVLVELVGPYNAGLQEYEGISVVDGIASATEADVLAGSGSLNALADGTYWVLSSRPSNGTLAISLTNRQLITE